MTFYFRDGKWSISYCGDSEKNTSAFNTFCEERFCTDCLDRLLIKDEGHDQFYDGNELNGVSGEVVVLINEEDEN